MAQLFPADHPAPFPYDHFVNYFPDMAPPANTAEFLTACGNRAMLYLSDYNSVWLKGERRKYAACLLAAHIIYLDNQMKRDGGADGHGDLGVGPVTSTGVGGVSISMQAPNSSSDGPFEWWLNKSPYGQEFLALTRVRGPYVAVIGSRTPVLPLR